VLGNGMIMLSDAETEYRRVVRLAEPPERVNTQGIYVVVKMMLMLIARGPGRRTPRSCASS
jgi:carbamate kinase